MMQRQGLVVPGSDGTSELLMVPGGFLADEIAPRDAQLVSVRLASGGLSFQSATMSWHVTKSAPNTASSSPCKTTTN
jgi:hypothetical protein